MIKPCALLTLLGLASALPAVPKWDDRIVGGSPAVITEAPYQVSLMRDPFQIGAFMHSCGGSVLSSRTILTAAHCIDGTIDPQWRVRSGSSYHDEGGFVNNVGRLIRHPNYVSSTTDNDVGLVIVVDYLTLGSTVAVARLPSQGQPIADGALALVTGWGVTSENSATIPKQLQKVTVPVVNQQLCASAYSDLNPITVNMVCAGRLTSGGVDACQGDSGGPMMVGGTLVGVTSWGNGCARPNRPGVYARVPQFRMWIDSNLQ